MEGYVKSEISKEGITTIEFYNPSHNSLSSEYLVKIVQSIEEADRNVNCQIILIKSGGNRTFCAGANFDELITITKLDQGIDFFSGFGNVINAIRKCSKIIVARVQGKVVGGGVGLVAACDYCFGTKHSSVKLSELSIGIGPFVIGPAVEKKIGTAAFAQLSLDSNQFYTAEWALEKGLFQSVSESSEIMDENIEKFALNLVATNLEARTYLKKALWEGTEHWDSLLAERAKISGQLVLSDFTKQRLQEFKK